MTGVISITKDEFRNTTPGHIGVVTINARGEQRAIAVSPGDTVWLSEQEQILTANAPRSDEDNPLVNGSLVLITEAREIKNKRPIRPATVEAEAEEPTEEETGAPPTPTGPAPEGERPATEEVGTPEAALAGGGSKRRRPS